MVFNANVTKRFLIALILFSVSAIQCQQDKNHEALPAQPVDITALFNISYPSVSYFLGENEKKELSFKLALEHLDHTITAFGPWGLAQSFNATSDLVEIERRKERLKLLVENDQAMGALEGAFTRIKQHQESLLNYYKPHCAAHDEMDKLYYSSLTPCHKELNGNRHALDASFLIDCGKSLAFLALHFGVQGIIERFSLQHGASEYAQTLKTLNNEMVSLDAKGTGELVSQSRFYEAIYDTVHKVKSVSISQAIQKGLTEPFNVNKKIYDLIFNCADPEVTFINKYHEATQVLYYNTALGYGLYSMYKQLAFLWVKSKELTEQMRSLAELCSAMQEVSRIISGLAPMADWSVASKLHEMGHLQESGMSAKLKEFITLLQEIRNDTSSLFYSRGRILLAHALMNEVKHELITYLQALAQIEALYSVAQLYKKQTPQNPWCFVTFSTDCSSMLHAKDFWLPLVPGDVVLNSLEWSADKGSKMVITGPNGGGKSTIMKALAYQVLCAQAWGIAPSAQLTMSCFTQLCTALNPQEDIKRGMSTFMAQREKMQEIEQIIKKNPGSIMIIVDEPYRGTVQSTAEKLVYEFGKACAQDDNALMLLATHFELPTQLAAECKQFVNYQCEFKQTDAGLERTFKLQPGVATWWFQDDRMRSLYLAYLDKAGALTH